MSLRILIGLSLAAILATSAPTFAQTRQVCITETVGTGPDAWIVYRCHTSSGPIGLPQRLRR
jgi:hypothetical protein